MNEEDKFHQIALQSILFKGRYDWYFCYLKSERIAHVLSVLAQSADAEDLNELTRDAIEIPHTILHFAAGEVGAEALLADLLSIITSLRIGATRGSLKKENMQVLVKEYEQIGEKIAAHNRPSPFVTPQDFVVPLIEKKEPEGLLTSLPRSMSRSLLKDGNKGQLKVKDNQRQESRQSERMSLILDLVIKSNGISIKDISAVIRDCSEKTIQRELVVLIRQGLIRKMGERRWSQYLPVSQAKM